MQYGNTEQTNRFCFGELKKFMSTLSPHLHFVLWDASMMMQWKYVENQKELHRSTLPTGRCCDLGGSRERSERKMMAEKRKETVIHPDGPVSFTQRKLRFMAIDQGSYRHPACKLRLLLQEWRNLLIPLTQWPIVLGIIIFPLEEDGWEDLW